MSNISKISLGGEVYDITLTQEKFNALLKGGSPGLTYEISEDGTYATCTGMGNFTGTDLVIASEYKGVPVTSIGDYAFSGGADDLTSITIPDSVTSIGDAAFEDCHSLTSIEIPNSVISIGTSAFYYCQNLTSVTIGSGVTNIGSSAFVGCENLESITLPFVGATKDGTSDTHFGYIFGASSYSSNSTCVPSSLKTVVITGGTSIGDYAFYNCSNLTSIVIPDSVTSIGHYAFSECKNLTSVEIGDGVTSIGYNAFYNCYRLTSIEIPEGVTSINYAFYACSSLKSVIIPDSVTSIGEMTFYKCSSLKSIVIPDSVTFIGEDAFRDCTGLTSIEIPDSTMSIGNQAFDGCRSLKSITIPDSVTNIGSKVFSSCTSLTIYCEAEEQPEGWASDWNYGNRPVVWGAALDIPAINDKLKSDNGSENSGSSGLAYELSDDGTYATCTGIGTCSEMDIIIASEYRGVPVTSIGQAAFSYCDNLTSVTIPDSVTTIDGDAFNYCSGLTSVIIPDSVTTIGNSAFIDCHNLTGITIPNSVTSIGTNVFAGCSTLESITIPGSVTSIDNFAFCYCSRLTSVVIPDSVTSIGDSVFSGCTSLTIYCEAAEQPAGWNAYWNSYNRPVVWGAALDIPAINDKLNEIQGLAIVGGSEGLTYELSEDGTYATCTGTDNCPDTDIVIASTYQGKPVTRIGDYAFRDCSSLTSITIPNSVTSIGLHCLYGCSNLRELSIPFVGPYLDAGYSTDGDIFENCHLGYLFGTTDGDMETMPEYVPSSLTTLHITNGTIIGAYCTCMCSQIQTITLPKTLKRIGEGAFEACGISNIELPETLTSIGSYSFYLCENLSSIKLPNSLQKIEECAFGESGLTHIEFPNTLEYIGDYAFYECAITNVSFPIYIKYLSGFSGCAFETKPNIPYYTEVIGASAFEGCTGLGDIWLSSDLLHTIGEDAFAYSDISSISTEAKNIGDSAFEGCNNLTSATLASYTGETGKAMFKDCTQLTEIAYGGSLKVIPEEFCSGCSQLNRFYLNDSYGSVAGSKFSITDIRAKAFNGCTKLSSAYGLFSDTLRFIGEKAFNGCTSLNAPLHLATSLQYIDSSAFYGATIAVLPQDSSNSFKVPNSVTHIYYDAFAGSNLTKVYIPDTVNYLGANAFDNTVVCYCEAPYQPYSWHMQWNSGGTVHWGATVGTSSHLPIITDDVLVGAILTVALDEHGNKIWKIQNPPTELYTGEVE